MSGNERASAVKTSGESLKSTGTGGSQSQRSYEHIKRELLKGRFHPGENLPINLLANEIGVSRQPVFDAMRRLARDHLIDIIPQVGCRVATLRSGKIDDFFRLFASVEALLATLAAERHDRRDLRDLMMVSTKIGNLQAPEFTPAEQSNGYRAANREFHGLIHEMARAPEIASFAQGCWDRSDFYLTSSSTHRFFSQRLAAAQKEHEEIIAMIGERNGLQVSARMSSHIDAFRRELLTALRESHTAN